MQLKDPKSDVRRRLLTCTALVAVCTWAPLNAASAQVNVVANGTSVDLFTAFPPPTYPNFNCLTAVNGGQITNSGPPPVNITFTQTQYGASRGGQTAVHDGTITLNGVNVFASDPTYIVNPISGPRGLAAEGAGAVLNATNFNINLSHTGSTSAENGTGLRAVHSGILTAIDGTVTMTGSWNHGIVASGGIVDTNATVVVNGGAAPGQAYGAFAIGEQVSQFGPSTIFLRPGSSITNHSPDHGIGLYSLNFPDGASIIDSHATVLTTGAVAGYGAIAQGGGIIFLRGGSVTTTGTGERNHGLYTFDRGLIVADPAFGEVRTSGPTSHGALAQSGVIQLNGTTIVTTGAGSHGILAEPSGGLGGRVYPTGATDPNPVGTGDVTVIVNGNVTASGQSSRGIFANASTGGNAYVETSSAVLGGWGSGAAGVHLVYGLNGFARINAGSTVGALSDLAISGTTTGVGGTLQIENAGTVTGFVQFGGGDNSFLNNGLFNLRHFADTTGGGRDTLRVAIADLGTGPNNSFTNNGTLALPAVTGATALDSTGQYLPLGNLNNAMTLGGPLQGHLIGVGASTFINSGIIDLQSNPAAGDVLVITGCADGRGCRPRHLHLQWRHAEARHGPQRGRRRNALRYVGRGWHVGRRGRPNKHGNPQRWRHGCANHWRRHPGGGGTEPSPLRSRRVFAPGRLHHRRRV